MQNGPPQRDRFLYNKYMKKVILLLLAVVLLGVLVVVYIPFTPATPAMGADRDEHGCIASAGYTYSVVRNACVRLWEVGTALVPVVSEGDPVLNAYVVQSEDGATVEVFLPGFSQGLVMKRAENTDIPTWTANHIWTLTYDPDPGWKFLQQGQLLYASKAQ